jgi:predicted RNA-binding protein YlqC (UPF0109 family)
LESTEAFKDLAQFIVESLVDNPDQVNVREVATDNTILVEVQVAQSDMGRVIGRGGTVVNSIRTLLQVLAVKADKRVSLEIIED